jgi:GntR family transcriptional repressor for pyruvate dehydrogenase complex
VTERQGSSGQSLGLPRFERQPTLVERVTQHLLDMIVAGSLRTGEKLPSERDLAEQLGVSRTVVREAIRSLQARGVLAVRSGSGMEVARISPERASEALRLFIHLGDGALLDGLGYEQVHEVREMIEVRVAGLAARHATEADIERLGTVFGELRTATDLEHVSAADVAFHRTIAEMTHNVLYLVMLDSIGDVLLDIRRSTLGQEGRHALALEAHGRILECIAAGDEAGARAAMEAHLQESKGAWDGEITSGTVAP